MQTFTKNEIAWIASEMEKLSLDLGKRAKNDNAKGLAAGFMNLRSEQYANIASKLQKAIEEDEQRIRII